MKSDVKEFVENEVAVAKVEAESVSGNKQMFRWKQNITNIMQAQAQQHKTKVTGRCDDLTSNY